MQQKPILVLGGNGKTGRLVLAQLEARGLPTRLGSRQATPPFDWDDQATWRAALEGTRAVYISYQPDLAVEGAQWAEAVLQASDADWTILRASWFFQNFSESFLLDAVMNGVVALPIADVQEPFVDTRDIADVAVAALTEEGHVATL